MKHFLDAGTTWSKILTVDKAGEKSYKVLKTADLKALGLTYERTTGHSTDFNDIIHENEIVAMALGAKEILKAGKVVLDLGSRDIKWVKFKDGKFSDMDWNGNCASATGATIEMLLKFYNIESKKLEAQEEKYTVTCGIFGLERIMDDVSKGLDPKIAIAKFIHGVAFNAWNFTRNPDELAISGGFCENECFVKSLSRYTKVTTLGRFVLVDGLYNEYKGV